MKNAKSKLNQIFAQVSRWPEPFKVGTAIMVSVLAAGTVVGLRTQFVFWQGDRAYKQGECGKAIPKLAIFLDRQSNSADDKTRQAAAQKAECEYYQSLSPVTDAATAIVNTHDHAVKYPNTRLGTTLKNRTVEAFRQVRLSEIVTELVCDRLFSLFVQSWLPRTDSTAPELGILCGQMHARKESFGKAADAFEYVLTNHATYKLAIVAEAGYATACRKRC